MSDEQSAGFGEPQFDAPPTDMHERRMHMRARRYWSSLLQGRAFPCVGDLDADGLDAFGPNSVLVDLGRATGQPVLRFVGRKLRDESSLPLGVQPSSAVAEGSVLARLLGRTGEVLSARSVVEFEDEFVSKAGKGMLSRGVLMPLSSDGESIDFIYAVANWKEMAGADLAAGLAAEVERMLEASPARVIAEAFSNGSDLLRRLERARAAAVNVASADARSRAALYRALGDAWDFHLSAAADPAGFAALLAEAGINRQARAPMTAVAKLVFGADYDKGRLTEFAAALAHADRLGVPRGGFVPMVEGCEGGLKAVVAAERAARRAGRPPVDRATAARERLRHAKALARVPVTAQGDAEFVLLVARREDGALAVVDVLPEADALVEAALRRLGGGVAADTASGA